MISFYFHPNYSGSAIQALNLSRHLISLGVKPLIVCANLSRSPAQDEVSGIPIFRLPVLQRRDWQIPSFSVSLLKFLLRYRDNYDVIHAHGTLQHVAASLAGRLLGKPTLLKVAMANSDLAFHRHGRLMGRANKALVRRFDLYVATTPTIAQEFKDRGLDPARIRLIPNGVDTSVFTPVSCEERIHRRRSMGLPDGQLVTYVGIINSRKNIDGMLRIWSKVCASNHSAHFALIGPIPSENDPFYRDIISFVRNAGLAERVTFMGLRETVVPYLQASDAFLFASRREGMPNSVLEAMSCGLPCVISRQAGLLEIVHDGINGCSMDVEDEEGFARALRRILEDPEQADRIGREARRTIISELSLRSTAERYRELYSRLVV